MIRQATLANQVLPRGSSEREPAEEFRDYFRSLLQKLHWPAGCREPSGTLRTLGITSYYSGEGVSTVAAHLAAAAASLTEQPVVLVDANLGKPSLHSALGMKPGPGLADALLDGDRAAELVRPSPLPGLAVLTAGASGGRLDAAYESPSLSAAVDSLKTAFALAVFDLPALGQAAFAARLAGLLDGVLLVVEAERTRREVVRREKEVLAQGNAHVLGAVLNKRRQHIPSWLYRFV